MIKILILPAILFLTSCMLQYEYNLEAADYVFETYADPEPEVEYIKEEDGEYPFFGIWRLHVHSFSTEATEPIISPYEGFPRYLYVHNSDIRAFVGYEMEFREDFVRLGEMKIHRPVYDVISTGVNAAPMMVRIGYPYELEMRRQNEVDWYEMTRNPLLQGFTLITPDHIMFTTDHGSFILAYRIEEIPEFLQQYSTFDEYLGIRIASYELLSEFEYIHELGTYVSGGEDVLIWAINETLDFSFVSVDFNFFLDALPQGHAVVIRNYGDRDFLLHPAISFYGTAEERRYIRFEADSEIAPFVFVEIPRDEVELPWVLPQWALTPW